MLVDPLAVVSGDQLDLLLAELSVDRLVHQFSRFHQVGLGFPNVCPSRGKKVYIF